ncbi:hypothetical protein QBC45DRAFT_393028 [Copromyces sp. CBS 386.78]|nr:hypothetical protein QBC45DRAFT_393028 [Copromyces sp. CBS 386.78]
MDKFQNLDELRSKMDPYAHIESWAKTLEKKTTQPQPANRAAADQNELIDIVKDVKVTSCFFKDKKYTFTEVDGVLQETAVRHRHGRVTRTKNGKAFVEKPKSATCHFYRWPNYDTACDTNIAPTPVPTCYLYMDIVPVKPIGHVCTYGQYRL